MWRRFLPRSSLFSKKASSSIGATTRFLSTNSVVLSRSAILIPDLSLTKEPRVFRPSALHGSSSHLMAVGRKNVFFLSRFSEFRPTSRCLGLAFYHLKGLTLTIALGCRCYDFLVRSMLTDPVIRRRNLPP